MCEGEREQESCSALFGGVCCFCELFGELPTCVCICKGEVRREAVVEEGGIFLITAAKKGNLYHEKDT